MTDRPRIAFLFDCDNTLIDNDAIERDLRKHLERQFGKSEGDRYWKIFEKLRAELGIPDYVGALERYRKLAGSQSELLLTASYLVDYPFRKRVYPGAAKALRHAGRMGTVVIASDGDVILQPRKIEKSGLWDLVEGRVMLFTHKEERTQSLCRRYPADHYVMVDDRRKILRAMKTQLGERLTTVSVKQGSMARKRNNTRLRFKPDIALNRIGDLLRYDAEAIIAAAA